MGLRNGNISDYVSTNGAVVAHYEYSPYGNVTQATGTMADNFAFKFSTKYWDAETGLGYWGYRYYDAKQGRWLGRDPLEEQGGVNLYAYVRNSPVLFVDILGLSNFYLSEDGSQSWLDTHFAYISSSKVEISDISSSSQGYLLTDIYVEVSVYERHSGGDAKKHEDEHVKDFKQIAYTDLELFVKKWAGPYKCKSTALCVKKVLETQAASVYRQLASWKTVERVDMGRLYLPYVLYAIGGYESQRDRLYNSWESLMKAMDAGLKTCTETSN